MRRSARKADRLAVRQGGQIVAVVEIVSPGNKSSRAGLRSFVAKSRVDRAGVHLLVIDLFHPPARSPGHSRHLDDFEEDDEEFTLPADKPLTLASYDAGPADGLYRADRRRDVLPEMPLFLEPESYVRRRSKPLTR